MTLMKKLDALPMDKVMHALVGALIVSVLFPLDPLVAAGAAAGAGVGKELADKAAGKEPDWIDAVVTIAGAAPVFAWHWWGV